MALFDQRRDAGRQIAEAVANARGRIPRTLPAPLMKPTPEPVFELGGTQTPYGPGDYSGMSTMQGYQPNITAMPNPAGPVAPAAGLGPVQQPQTGSSFGLSGGLSAANTLSKIPSYAETLAPLWEAPSPGIGLNTIFSGQGGGSVAGGIDSAVNAGLGGGGLFGAAVPAAVVPGGATAASIGGIGSSAATAAFNPAWATAINPAVLAAAPLALPFVMQGLFGGKDPWNPRESAEGLNRVVADYAARPDFSLEELTAARERIDNMRQYSEWPVGHPNYRPSPNITPEEMAAQQRLLNIGPLAFGAVPSLRGENTPTGEYAIFHQYMTPQAKQFLLDNADAYSDAYRASRAAYPEMGNNV